MLILNLNWDALLFMQRLILLELRADVSLMETIDLRLFIQRSFPLFSRTSTLHELTKSSI